MRNNFKIAVTSTSFSQSATLVGEVQSLGWPVTANVRAVKLRDRELASFINDASIVIVGTEPMTAEIFSACPNIKLIAKYGVGKDNLDLKSMRERGIELGWTGGINRRSVAELVLGFMLGHFRNITSSSLAMRTGEWKKQGGRQLSDVTVGIIGFGHTGSEVARLLSGLGLGKNQILYNDVRNVGSEAASIGATYSSFEKILTTCDAITFHVPLDDTTRRMYGVPEIERTRTGTLIINTARGEVVDFQGTCAAVQRGNLGGFAADVYPSEPFDGRPFAGEGNLYFTPHIGGNSAEAVLAMGRAAIGHVQSFIDGKKGNLISSG